MSPAVARALRSIAWYAIVGGCAFAVVLAAAWGLYGLLLLAVR